MASGLSSNVGRIINFPKRGKNNGSAEVVKVVLPLVAALAWRLLESRQSTAEKGADTAKATAGKVKEQAGKVGATVGKKATAAKGTRKRRSARYYAITALITALENPTTRKIVISGLKLARNVL